MTSNGYDLRFGHGTRRWRCAVKDKRRQHIRYDRDFADMNYKSVRRRLRQRISRKKEMILQLEESLAQEERY